LSLIKIFISFSFLIHASAFGLPASIVDGCWNSPSIDFVLPVAILACYAPHPDLYRINAPPRANQSTFFNQFCQSDAYDPPLAPDFLKAHSLPRA